METIDNQYLTLRSLGYIGALPDMLLAYYNSIEGTSFTALEDAQYYYFRSFGFVGAVPDMLYQNDSVFLTNTFFIRGGTVSLRTHLEILLKMSKIMRLLNFLLYKI